MASRAVTRRMVVVGAVAAAAACKPKPSTLEPLVTTTPRTPVLFIGHGSPMNALEDNPWSRGMAAMGAALPTPKAIVCVSAHWYLDGTFVTGTDPQKTIHDFGGFPRALYEVQYPAAGHPALAKRVASLIGGAAVSAEWGLDHGTWSVLRHLRPKADVPVIQLSLDRRKTPAQHLALAKALAPLRDEGVLLLGSGNVTHNLGHAMRQLQTGDASTPAWAKSFDDGVAQAVAQRDTRWLATALESDAGRLSHPSPDHYLPLLYAAAAAEEADAVSFPITGFDLGSLSMRAVRFG